MSADKYINYTSAPGMSVSYDCAGWSCGNDSISHDGDDFVCSDCGTAWEHPDSDGRHYGDWSGDPDGLHPFKVDPNKFKAQHEALAERAVSNQGAHDDV